MLVHRSLAILMLVTMSTSFTFEVPQAVLDFFYPRLRLPQFMLDAGHPWLKQNRRMLNRQGDTQQALCSLESELRPGNGGIQTYPPDLFRRLEINNNRAGIDRGGWSNAVARIKEMLSCPAALKDVEEFQVEIYASDGSYGVGVPQTIDPPSELPLLFVNLLKSMPNLKKLEWETFGSGNNEFRAALANSNLSLPSVKHLRPAKSMECFVSVCPSLEVLESGGSRYWRSNVEGDPGQRLIESAFTAKNLSHFSLNTEWNLAHLEAMLQSMSNISRLGMHGTLEPIDHSYDEFTPQPHVLESFVKILSRFPKLKDLDLPSSSDLLLGFDGGPWCGNAYFGRSGREYGRRVSKQSAESTETAGVIALSKLQNLDSLNIGDYCANLTRDENGWLNATWPWTGRMVEWTYEEWPERDYPGEEDYD